MTNTWDVICNMNACVILVVRDSRRSRTFCISARRRGKNGYLVSKPSICFTKGLMHPSVQLKSCCSLNTSNPTGVCSSSAENRKENLLTLFKMLKSTCLSHWYERKDNAYVKEHWLYIKTTSIPSFLHCSSNLFPARTTQTP